MILKDGGELSIPTGTLIKWVELYPYVYIQEEIDNLSKQGVFAKLSKKGALKLINRTLKEKNAANYRSLKSKKKEVKNNEM